MKRSILIVDDEFGLADLLAEVLAEHGYGVALAINGQQGLAQLENEPPDLVLLDVMMPIVTGPEMLRKMRSEERTRQIPVVLMTALPESVPDDLGGLYQGLLQKPFPLKALFELLDRLLP